MPRGKPSESFTIEAYKQLQILKKENPRARVTKLIRAHGLQITPMQAYKMDFYISKNPSWLVKQENRLSMPKEVGTKKVILRKNPSFVDLVPEPRAATASEKVVVIVTNIDNLKALIQSI